MDRIDQTAVSVVAAIMLFSAIKERRHYVLMLSYTMLATGFAMFAVGGVAMEKAYVLFGIGVGGLLDEIAKLRRMQSDDSQR